MFLEEILALAEVIVGFATDFIPPPYIVLFCFVRNWLYQFRAAPF